MRLTAAASFGSDRRSRGARTGPPPISPNRRSINAAAPGASAIAAAATSSEPNRNASRGSNRFTLHLDLDDLANPEVADRLHDDGDANRHLPHAVLEQQLGVLRADERQRERERR